MPLNAGQIIALACADARCPGYTTQAKQSLNQILADLCQQYDFQVCRKTDSFSFNSARGTGSGPYTLLADYLRANYRDVFYTIRGVPYFMTSIDLAEYDALVQTAGFNDFPRNYATDLSGAGSPFSSGFSPGFGPHNPAPRMYVWPPASGSYPVTIRYFAQMPDVVDDGTVPWFPNQTYLRRRLAGELMALTDDERMAQFLGDNEDTAPNGAGVILRKYLRMEGDKGTRAQTVKLDARRFGPEWNRLRNTKLVGW